MDKSYCTNRNTYQVCTNTSTDPGLVAWIEWNRLQIFCRERAKNSDTFDVFLLYGKYVSTYVRTYTVPSTVEYLYIFRHILCLATISLQGAFHLLQRSQHWELGRQNKNESVVSCLHRVSKVLLLPVVSFPLQQRLMLDWPLTIQEFEGPVVLSTVEIVQDRNGRKCSCFRSFIVFRRSAFSRRRNNQCKHW